MQLRSFYRLQLRTARYFDANAQLKPLLSIPGSAYFGPPNLGAELERQRDAFVGPTGLYEAGSPSLYDCMRSAYASKRRLANPGKSISDAVNAQRLLVVTANTAAILDAHPENVIPQLPQELGAIEEAPVIGPGTLLVEHPSIVRPGRALIYIYDVSRNLQQLHGNEDWVVRGYVVNRPFPFSVAGAGGTTSAGQPDLGAFGKLSLFHGGLGRPAVAEQQGGSAAAIEPVRDGPEVLSVLHRRADVPGAQAVWVDPQADSTDSATTSKGSALYVGGSIQHINGLLDSGAASPGDFKVVMGSVEFALRPTAEDDSSDAAADANPGSSMPSNLEMADADHYYVIRGPGADDLAMLPALFGAGSGLSASDKMEGYNHARFWHQNAAWAAAVRGLAADPAVAPARAAELAAFARLHPAVVHAVSGGLPLRYDPEAALPEPG
jgi:hypothetical protein